jgi:hypothetical protein
VSKYRIEFKISRLLVIFQLLSCIYLIFTMLNWQPDIFKYGFLLQILIISITIIYFLKRLLLSSHETHNSVILSERGEWMETNIDGQVSWKITDKSRVSIFLVFVHLISPVNNHNSKWCLVFKDQVSEQDYRRICRAVIYQQRSTEKN